MSNQGRLCKLGELACIGKVKCARKKDAEDERVYISQEKFDELSELVRVGEWLMLYIKCNLSNLTFEN